MGLGRQLVSKVNAICAQRNTKIATYLGVSSRSTSHCWTSSTPADQREPAVRRQQARPDRGPQAARPQRL